MNNSDIVINIYLNLNNIKYNLLRIYNIIL